MTVFSIDYFCEMVRKSILIFAGCLLGISSFAQKKWGLLDCVQYAMDNNISIKQQDIQSKIAAINYKQSKLSEIPTANISNSEGYRFGKSQDPSTGILENQNYFQIGLNLQSSAVIFNWFSKRNAILANQWSLEAARAATDKLRNDVSLNVANAYLQVLLAIQQQDIAAVQVEQDSTQLELVNKQVVAGALPELNAVEIEAQLATDSATLISATGNVSQSKFILKAYMGMDADVSFDIEEPPVDQIPIMPIADLQPADVYASAIANQPQQKYNEYSLRAAQKSALAAKGALYPTIAVFGSLGTNYGFYRSPTYEQILTGYVPSGLVINNGSGYTDVLAPVYMNGGKNGYITSPSLSTQFNNNFGQSIGISLSIPIFNGWQTKANYEISKLNIQNKEYQIKADNQALRQNIYQAYNAAVVALNTFNSSRKSVEAAQESYDFALKRYNIGMLTTLELITDQNNLFRAKLQYISNQFDYIFKMKVLEFYKENGIKF
jgi:outer membrane protein